MGSEVRLLQVHLLEFVYFASTDDNLNIEVAPSCEVKQSSEFEQIYLEQLY